MFSVTDVFPQVSLNFAGGASMILRPQDYLLQQNSVVSIQFFPLFSSLSLWLFNWWELVYIFYLCVEIAGELMWDVICLFSWIILPLFPCSDYLAFCILFLLLKTYLECQLWLFNHFFQLPNCAGSILTAMQCNFHDILTYINLVSEIL